MEGDLYQEQLQDELYEQIGGKDAAFADKYVQHVIVPNVHHFVCVKKDINESLRLVQRSGKHTAPHADPELQKLMDTYQAEELHLFRRGQTYDGDETQIDHLGKGYEHLQDGKLIAWITETMRACNLDKSQPTTGQGPTNTESSTLDVVVTKEVDELAGVETDKGPVILTPGLIWMVNGSIIIDILEDDDEVNEHQVEIKGK